MTMPLPSTRPRPSPKRRVAVVINFLTNYRLDFYRRLVSRDDLDLTIYCHLPPGQMRLKSVHEQFPGRVKLVSGSFLGGEKIVWSSLPWAELSANYDAVFVEGNPRYLSFALLATYLHLRGRHVVLWTMVHSFRNSKARQSLRLIWTRIFKTLLVYSDAEALFLKEQQFNAQRIVGINNGLNQEAIDREAERWTRSRLDEWQQEHRLVGKRILLSCARLDEKNKFEQVIEILPELCRRHPDLVWCVIGDGALKDPLRQLAEQQGVADQVRWLGAMHDEATLAPWFLSAEMLLHPGAIGLTLLHAFGYGVPVVTHSNARTHGPEFAAFSNAHTGKAYAEDNRPGLSAAIESLLGDQVARASMSSQARQIARSQYNTQVMTDRFCDCIQPGQTASDCAN